ncbi:hypothetical protein M404DRAFT_832990 [Pisolithus tinctorius Marx 270]|uniref:Uncharacterized protein n=1 Tax=Pisolithus tinctorius Marx 270 TaxID=870435 RepID=A0A0C3JPH7_PISTI|nr:hypothetical protein M404DRAFT_832990 [Pisolithus tinctorius Marx 270]
MWLHTVVSEQGSPQSISAPFRLMCVLRIHHLPRYLIVVRVAIGLHGGNVLRRTSEGVYTMEKRHGRMGVSRKRVATHTTDRQLEQSRTRTWGRRVLSIWIVTDNG